MSEMEYARLDLSDLRADICFQIRHVAEYHAT